MPGYLRIAHLSSVHSRYDTRIFLKQCRTLAAAGHDVTLVVADGKGNEVRDGVSIVDVGVKSGRLSRMTRTMIQVILAGARQKVDLYHVHDPELLLGAFLLKALGKRVIFDAHEDLPRQVMSKSYIPKQMRRLFSAAAGLLENFFCKRLDAVAAATPPIQRKFALLGIKTEAICNYPLLGELEGSGRSPAPEGVSVCYIGGVTEARGIREVVGALSICQSGVRLALAGNFDDTGLRSQLAKAPEWSLVDELGFVDRIGVKKVLADAIAGIVTLHPTPAYLESLPIKMFEYMSAGLPVVASHFPLWQEIVEGNACGICVDPTDPVAIAAAIDRLVSDPELARRLGENGRKAVQERYNWSIEEQKLLHLYARVVE